MFSSHLRSVWFGALAAIVSLPLGGWAQALETEESAPLHQGQIELGTGLEHQVSSEGTETALPMAFEVGLTDKLTLLVEPVAFTWIRPDVGRHAFGIGDLEASLFYQVLSEQSIQPAVSIAGEVKFPTARNTLIGSGKFDYTPFLVVSKTTGKFFSSLNLGYTFIGKPQGVLANDLVNFAIGTIFQASERNRLYAEVYGNTAATESPEGASAGSTELSGGETVGAIAYGYELADGLEISLGASYDNNNAVLIRPGISWKFGGN